VDKWAEKKKEMICGENIFTKMWPLSWTFRTGKIQDAEIGLESGPCDAEAWKCRGK
jgi:hypothetical protein